MQAVFPAHRFSNRIPQPDPWTVLLILIALTMAIFGLFNGLELPFGWKDRSEQITRYLSAAGINTSLVQPALVTAKSTEFILGVFALVALATQRWNLLLSVLAGWMVMFTHFIAMDVIAADRMELTEHTVYQAVFAVLFATVAFAKRHAVATRFRLTLPRRAGVVAASLAAIVAMAGCSVGRAEGWGPGFGFVVEDGKLHGDVIDE